MLESVQHRTRLSALLHGMLELPATLDREITGIELDSRCVEPGSLFMAYKGESVDGREFIADAIKKGANAVLVEADSQWRDCSELESVPIVALDALPAKLHALAAKFYEEPASSLRLIGITGTNGKTSCCHLLANLLAKLGYQCGVIGTLGFGITGKELEQLQSGPSTTPDALKLQKLLAMLKAAKADTVVMEVSSHGIEQKRIDVNDFSYAVFTNLSRDHLDYHGSIEAYGSVKRELFQGSKLKAAVLNLDDSQSAGTRTVLDENLPCFTWSIEDNNADVYTRELNFTAAGVTMLLVTPWGEFLVQSPLLGSFNVSNLLGTLCAAFACEAQKDNFNPELIISYLQELKPVPGRMQLVGVYPVTVVVDYAHTPDGLEKALSAVREHCTGKIICVFGCGGGRDQGKRPTMGEVAEGLADSLVVTDDNPRNEDSKQIIRSILAGISNKEQVLVIADRASAIKTAIELAEAGDIVLIAGKGHEDYQERNGKRIPFSDVEQAERVLKKRFGSAGVQV